MRRGLKPGDYAILLPGPSKADCFGQRWGNNPIWLPFDPHAAINAAHALAAWELCARVAPEARRTTPAVKVQDQEALTVFLRLLR